MERIDLSNLSDEKLVARAGLSRNDHWHYAKKSDEKGMAASLAEYNRIRIEQCSRQVSRMTDRGDSLDVLKQAERELAFVQAQFNYWSTLAAGPQAVAV